MRLTYLSKGIINNKYKLMEKKTYMKPCIMVVKVETEGQLITSTGDSEETDNGYFDIEDLFGDEDEEDDD